MEKNELMHWGIKGMKWGVRRYQNADGTLTDLGERRYAREQREKNDKNANIVADPKKWVREDNRRAKNLADAGSQGMNNARALNRQIANDRAKSKMDLSKMSDADLREAVNRANLERQYLDAYGPSTVGKGQQCVDKILQYGGATLAVVGSALSIAVAIKELKD